MPSMDISIAAALLHMGWGYSFLVPGLLMMGSALLIWAFLVVAPSDVGLTNPESPEDRKPRVRAASGLGWG